MREEDYTVIGYYPDNGQSYMTCAKGTSPDEAIKAARATIEDEYERNHMTVLIVLKGDFVAREVRFTRED